ncbi:hypothetical protein CCR79_12675 [Halorhodospira halophila]|nr:hypothetical protein [Halorhodospira halophila]
MIRFGIQHKDIGLPARPPTEGADQTLQDLLTGRAILRSGHQGDPIAGTDVFDRGLLLSGFPFARLPLRRILRAGLIGIGLAREGGLVRIEPIPGVVIGVLEGELLADPLALALDRDLRHPASLLA